MKNNHVSCILRQLVQPAGQPSSRGVLLPVAAAWPSSAPADRQQWSDREPRRERDGSSRGPYRERLGEHRDGFRPHGGRGGGGRPGGGPGGHRSHGPRQDRERPPLEAKPFRLVLKEAVQLPAADTELKTGGEPGGGPGHVMHAMMGPVSIHRATHALRRCCCLGFRLLRLSGHVSVGKGAQSKRRGHGAYKAMPSHLQPCDAASLCAALTAACRPGYHMARHLLRHPHPHAQRQLHCGAHPQLHLPCGLRGRQPQAAACLRSAPGEHPQVRQL